MSTDERVLVSPDWHTSVVFELRKIESLIESARAATTRVRTGLRPGLADSVVSMLDSDLEGALGRVRWLLERVEAEGGGDG